MVTDYVPSTGGTTSQVRLQASELLRRGWDVDVLTRRLSRRWRRSEIIEGVRVRRVGRPGYEALSKFYDLVGCWLVLLSRYRRIDAIQAIMDPDYVVVAWLAGLSGRTSMIWATDGDAGQLMAGLSGRIRKRAMRRCRQVVLTPAMAVELETSCGIAADAVIPVPVDVERFHPASEIERMARRVALSIESRVVIAYTGHLVERKGVTLLVEAFSVMRDVGANVHLLLVGGGEGRPKNVEAELRRFVADRGLGGHLTLTGVVQDVVPYLQCADIFCLPSYLEGMPNSILEAMGCGLACVAPASAGGQELLRDGAGIVPATNAVDDLVEAMLPLVASEGQRNELGVVARSRVRSTHSVSAVIDEYERLWRRSR